MAKNGKDSRQYGPKNPHPLSRIKTELVWEGKYDEYGNRRPVKLPVSPLPLQRIETIDEPKDRCYAQKLLYDSDKAHQDDFRNMLIWGDNKLIMASLLEQFRGKIDLIYIDPPFDVGADFTFQVQLGEEGDALHKEQSILEAVAYRDTWGKGTDSYLHMMYERLTLMRDLLSEKGSIYVHCDWRVNSYLRCLMDEYFAFRNAIVWHYSGWNKKLKNSFEKRYDSLLFYAKGDQQLFNSFFEKWSSKEEYVKKRKQKIQKDEKGREYVLSDAGGGERVKRYIEEALKEGVVIDDVWDLDKLNNSALENTGFDTQKPEVLLERIIKASSIEGDLVADFFCGSGTTLAVAEKLGRRWIGADLGRYAIHTTRKRLIQVQRDLHSSHKPYRSFDVYNLGRYERQWWQMERLKGADEEHRNIVLQFYKAAPLANPPDPLLHGKKAGAFVHVDRIDGIFTEDELRVAAEAARAAGGRELHCLAWEFEMELALKKQAVEAETGLDIKLKYIPREIMEPNRTECRFFEAGYLEAKAVKKGKKTDVELVLFSPALAEAPEAEIEELRKRALKSPFDFIDFWAVDFEWRDGKPFEHHWQDFRTRKDRSLKTKTNIGWEYRTGGKKKICIKVIDVFGVDTTAVVEAEA